MADRIKIGIIGAGRIGRVHAEHLSRRIPGAQVLAVADVNTAAAEACAADFSIPGIHADPLHVIREPEIDAIVICSSSDTHTDLIVEAAKAGKHIFCEKPIDIDLSRIDKALSAVEKAEVKFQIGFQRRFDPNFVHLQQLVQQGELGEPLILRITSRAPEAPSIDYIRASGGLFLDMMIHDFDMARFLIGDEVEEVYASGSARLYPEIGAAGDIDTATVHLKFRNGTFGTLDCCRRTGYGYDQRIEVFGSKALAQADNELPHRTSITTSSGQETPHPLYSFIERYQQAYLVELESFVLCLLRDTIPAITGNDGRLPVLIGHAAKRSLAQNRPVEIEEIERELKTSV